MAVDTSLIQGAYQANRPQKVVGVDEAVNIGGAVSGLMNQYMANEKAKHTKRSEEYEIYAQNVLANSDLTGDQYEALYDDLMLGKAEYANSDKKTRDLKLRDLQAMAGDYEDYKNLREEVAINIEDYSPAFTNSEEGKIYLDILKGEGKNLVNNNGRIGVEVDGEWKSISSIKQTLDSYKIDEASKDSLEAFRIKEQDDSTPFNREKTRTTILNQLINNGSYNSLINDEIIPGRIFRTDLAESLMNNTYSSLGITDEDFEGIEGVNSDGIIDADEAENIITHLEADKPLMNEVMADYYTNYVENNIVKRKPSRTEINSSYGYTDTQVRKMQDSLIEMGYEVERDGVFGPKTQEALKNLQDGIGPDGNPLNSEEFTGDDSDGSNTNEGGKSWWEFWK
tara:strand:- start:14924 stop:16111 length:1188 start_codon:yes stop_codon:yes gene_type:complete